MWFTQVSLKNPVFATMVMLAIVVLGLFSYQRLKVDQFPNIDFPVVVVTVDYPGASPRLSRAKSPRRLKKASTPSQASTPSPRAATRVRR